MPSEQTLHEAAAECDIRLAAIQDGLAKLRAEDFPSQAAIRLCDLFEKLTKFLRERLADHLDTAHCKKRALPDEALRDLFSIDSFAKQIAADLEHIDAAVATKVPWSLVQAVEDLLRVVVPDAGILLRPLWQYNYSICLEDLRRYYESNVLALLPEKDDESRKAIAASIFHGFPACFFVVYFPFLEQKSALMHCMLGHEIGHTVAARFLEQEDQRQLEIPLRDAAERAFRAQAQGRLSPVEQSLLEFPFINANIELIGKIRRRALEELISDLVGVKLFGPSILFAVSEFARTEGLDLLPTEERDHYPPWRYRLRKIIERLTECRYLPVPWEIMQGPPEPASFSTGVERHITELTTDAELDSDTKAVQKDPVLKEAYDLVSAAEDSVWRFVQNQLAKESASPADFYRDVPYVISRLRCKVPPTAMENEPLHPRPLNLPTIFCGAWFYRLSHFPSPLDERGHVSEEYGRERDILDRLVLFAVEMSWLQKNPVHR